MIRVIKRCLSKKTFTEHKWNGHFAFFHFKDYKNCFINGKPLKPWSILKNGDTIEIFEKPHMIFSAIAAFVLATVAAHPVIAAVLAIGVIGAVSAVVTSAVSKPSSPSVTSKEYSSSTQPELKGASNEISDGIVPVVFGKTQQTPSYGQLPYRLVVDGSSTNKYRQYFIANYNNVVYSNYKLGETPLTDYSIDYVDIKNVYGGSAFIGFDNVKAENIDEELSYNSDEDVNQNARYDYNKLTSTNSINIDFKLKFSNVDINNWGNKNFKLTIRIKNGDTESDLTKDFSITSSALTKTDDKTYVYQGSANFAAAVAEIVYTMFSPKANTRTNSTENTNELDSLYVEETITTDDWSNTQELNQSVNKYAGTVSEVVHTSPENTREIDVIISFPQGLFHQNNDGSRKSRSVNLEITYKEENGTYKPLSKDTELFIRDINGNKQGLNTTNTKVSGSKVTLYSPSDMNVADQLFYRHIGFRLPEKGKYTVRVRSADFADKTNFDIGYPRCAEIQYYIEDKIIDTSILPKVNQTAFEAIAYKGLSGTLKKFNYIAEARIPIWNGTDWNTKSKSENPAAIIRYLLTDKLVNPRAISLDLIDNDSLVYYYNWCEESGYKASGAIGEAAKILDIINEILKNSQAGMIPLFDGKHTFVVDNKDKIPVGMYNMHNSWDFNWKPSIGKQTQAIRASFTNNKDFTEDELTVYWYDNAVHEEIKPGTTDEDYEIVKKEYKYVNDRESVLRAAKWELEITQTKRNLFEFKVNLEGLNHTILDRVYVCNSANMQNESTGCIREVLEKDNKIIGFKLPTEIEIPENAKIIIRSLDYEKEEPVVNIYEITNSGPSNYAYIEPIELTEHLAKVLRGQGEIQGKKDKWFYDGDLFTIGQDTIYDCVITDIKYGEDLTATITARDF